VRIIKDPQDSLLSQVNQANRGLIQYQRLFSLNQVNLEFTNGAIRQIAKRCMSGTANGPSDGARGLRRVMEQVLERPQVYRIVLD
jgi:ATP-dependent Clp protease ATP-binding subunit ClpX